MKENKAGVEYKAGIYLINYLVNFKEIISKSWHYPEFDAIIDSLSSQELCDVIILISIHCGCLFPNMGILSSAGPSGKM